MIALDDLLAATGGQLVHPGRAREFTGFCYDSRRVHPGELFVAVKTDRGDGHDYIEQAVRGGATGVLCQSPPDLDGFPAACVLVPDTQIALSDWARFIIRKVCPRVVGITGSTGKTSAREAIAAVLGRRYRVFRNPSNFSGRFGLPIALGGLEAEHQVAVLEMACDSFGEIAHLAELAMPQVGVVTAVDHAHLAYLDSLEAIAQEKGRLVEALPPEGAAVLNYDDPRVRAMRERTRASVITYGLSPDADLVATNVRPDGLGLCLRVHFAGAVGLGLPGYPTKGELRTGLIGRHHAYTVLAAVAVGLLHGVPWDEIVDALEGLRPEPGRLNPLPGAGGCTILDDTCSASPASMLAALQALADYAPRAHRQGRRIAVLGGMAQLGGYALEGHRQAAQAAAAAADLSLIHI